jgi:hypothetical protein
MQRKASQHQGSAERLKYDFKRIWECPVCHRRQRTGGNIVSRLCPCQRGKPPHRAVWMKLIQDGPTKKLPKEAM